MHRKKWSTNTHMDIVSKFFATNNVRFFFQPQTEKHLQKFRNVTVPQISASCCQLPSIALTDKVPNEERSNSQEDQKPHENANQDSSLLLGRLLLVADKVDPLTVVAVTTLVQKTQGNKLIKHKHARATASAGSMSTSLKINPQRGAK